jgi:CHAT domain-containing protein
LHALPFHLMHDGAAYLVETRSVVVQPVAGLMCQPPPKRPRGVLALAHNGDDDAYGMEHCARAVKARFTGTAHLGAGATRAPLAAAPVQILHLGAHAIFNLNQPRLSHVQLADGPLYADDLLDYDLGYELVVLGACSTGLCRPSGGDELLGLGRSVLYGGAGALMASLWDVEDSTAEQFMMAFYARLDDGQNKADALRAAQTGLLAEHPGLHPAFWGAFQIIGNANPLHQN